MRKTAVQLEGDSHCNVNKHTDSHFFKNAQFCSTENEAHLQPGTDVFIL